MKTLFALIIFGSFSFAFANGLQDSTQNKNKEQEQLQVQEQEKNQSDEDQLKNRNRIHTDNQFPDGTKKKRGKDVFIDKDGDGIADTRAGGMSFNKIRKRTKSGQQGSGGHGSGGNGPGGNGGGK